MREDVEWGRASRELVRRAAERYADTEAVVEGRTRISYARARRPRRTRGGGLPRRRHRAGRPGRHLGPNTLDWIVAALGAVSAGAVLVPLNTRFKGTEAAYVLRRSGARLLFVTGTFLGTSYVASLRRAVARGRRALPELEQVVVLSDDAPAALPHLEGLPGGRRRGRGGRRSARAPTRCALRRPSDIIFTSGTTGQPKGAVITHAQTLRVLRRVERRSPGCAQGDRYLIVNPFFHTFGYKAGLIACLMRGRDDGPAAGLQRRHGPREHRARSAIIRAPRARPRCTSRSSTTRTRDHLRPLRAAPGRSPAPPWCRCELVERMRGELGIETVLTALRPHRGQRHRAPCAAAATTPTTIASHLGPGDPGHGGARRRRRRRRVPRASPARSWCAATTSCAATSRTPAATAAAHRRRTAGCAPATSASSTTAGNLRITDRIKDMFIVGGFNAYPAEIEHLLGLHPDVADVAVIGVPDARLGEVGKAYVVPRPGSRADRRRPDRLVPRREMANYKVPRGGGVRGGAAAERRRQGGQGGVEGLGRLYLFESSPP